MNTTQAAIIQLLQSYIGNKDKRVIFPQQVDWTEVCDVAVKHNIAGMLYAVIKKIWYSKARRKCVEEATDTFLWSNQP